MHEFDENDMQYGSETGNWYGHCAKCHKDLILYTGSSMLKPREVGPYALAHSNGDGHRTVIMQDFDLFVAGKPNAVFYIGVCQ